MLLKTADEWLQEPAYFGIVVLDPDGWDRKNYHASWNEKISEDEFAKRLLASTCWLPSSMPIYG